MISAATASNPDDVSSRDDYRPTASWQHLELRAGLLKRLRDFFDDHGFLEVQTPLLSADTVIDRHLDPIAVQFQLLDGLSDFDRLIAVRPVDPMGVLGQQAPDGRRDKLTTVGRHREFVGHTDYSSFRCVFGQSFDIVGEEDDVLFATDDERMS